MAAKANLDTESGIWVKKANAAQMKYYARLKSKIKELADKHDEDAIQDAVNIGIRIADLSHIVTCHKCKKEKGRNLMSEPTVYPPMPECEKLKSHQKESHAIGDFLEWVQEEKGWSLMRPSVLRDWDDRYDDYDDPKGDEPSNLGGIPAYYSLNQLLAEFFKVDLKKVEEEQRALLTYMRSKNDGQ